MNLIYILYLLIASTTVGSKSLWFWQGSQMTAESLLFGEDTGCKRRNRKKKKREGLGQRKEKNWKLSGDVQEECHHPNGVSPAIVLLELHRVWRVLFTSRDWGFREFCACCSSTGNIADPRGVAACAARGNHRIAWSVHFSQKQKKSPTLWK